MTTLRKYLEHFNHFEPFILVFFTLVIIGLLVFSFIFLFAHNNVLISYMLCELIVILVVFLLLWHPATSFSVVIQTYVLLFLGLVAAELALGLVIFIKYYRVTKNMIWEGE